MARSADSRSALTVDPERRDGMSLTHVLLSRQIEALGDTKASTQADGNPCHLMSYLLDPTRPSIPESFLSGEHLPVDSLRKRTYLLREKKKCIVGGALGIESECSVNTCPLLQAERGYLMRGG